MNLSSDYLANVAKSPLNGNRDHLLAEARSEHEAGLQRSMNFSRKLMLSDWNWRTPISDMESKFDYKKS